MCDVDNDSNGCKLAGGFHLNEDTIFHGSQGGTVASLVAAEQIAMQGLGLISFIAGSITGSIVTHQLSVRFVWDPLDGQVEEIQAMLYGCESTDRMYRIFFPNYS